MRLGSLFFVIYSHKITAFYVSGHFVDFRTTLLLMVVENRNLQYVSVKMEKPQLLSLSRAF